MNSKLKESDRKIEEACLDVTAYAGEGKMLSLKKGQVLRLIDVEGNQSGDVQVYNAHDTSERYSAQNTITAQANSMIELGTVIRSNDDNPMLTVIADTCGEHDTLGSGCSAEGNCVRYTDKTRYMHSCRDTFVRTLQDYGMSKRDQVCNLNFFTKVILDDTGRLEFADGISGPRKYIDLRAEMDVLFLLSDCSQLNNPCNDYNPTPIRMVVFNA
ncbi:MAG: urea carboxylase-associated family protein [Fibrobacter sp.]|nr:urea carboxylase-associated family protein [Fibrobacter sp.]